MNELQVYDCEQGTPEWFAARAGIPTASQFATVMASGRNGGESITRRKYMLTLAGEILTGKVEEGFSNAHMERGKMMEAEARNAYAMIYGAEPVQVGFMRRGRVGASPDSLIGEQGLIEIKTKLPHLQIECLLAGTMPREHTQQVQGQLGVSGREWCDFVSYWPGLPLFCVRVQRDEGMIARIQVACDEFNTELDDLVSKIREMN